MKYGKIVNGAIEYAELQNGGLVVGDRFIFNPSDEMYLEAGYYPIEDISEDGALLMDGGVIKNYTGRSYEPTPADLRAREIRSQLSNSDELIEALERLVAAQGITAEDRSIAAARIALRDELGKIIQTPGGDGSDMNPFQWTYGMEVEAGKWYKTPGDYIWEAIKSGVPGSETDREYFDVVGLD